MVPAILSFKRYPVPVNQSKIEELNNESRQWEEYIFAFNQSSRIIEDCFSDLGVSELEKLSYVQTVI